MPLDRTFHTLFQIKSVRWESFGALLFYGFMSSANGATILGSGPGAASVPLDRPLQVQVVTLRAG